MSESIFQEAKLDDKDINSLENDTDDKLIVINFDEKASEFGQVTLTHEEVERIYLSIKK